MLLLLFVTIIMRAYNIIILCYVYAAATNSRAHARAQLRWFTKVLKIRVYVDPAIARADLVPEQWVDRSYTIIDVIIRYYYLFIHRDKVVCT